MSFRKSLLYSTIIRFPDVNGYSHRCMMFTETRVSRPLSSAPDGGWGWAVCCACFFSHVLIDGLFYSFGVVYVELLDYFQESKGETIIIASLNTTVCYLIGPLVAGLVNKFGCRPVTIAGSIVASVSQAVGMFAPNIQFLYVTLGILTGIGYGLIFLPSLVAVSQYFDKRRAFAAGIAVSGSGIGTFVFSPLTSVLIQAYSWRGAIMVHSGLLLNCIACGLVYRPIKVGIPRKDSCSSEKEAVALINVTNNQINTSQTLTRTNGVDKDLDETLERDSLNFKEENSLLQVDPRYEKSSNSIVLNEVINIEITDLHGLHVETKANSATISDSITNSFDIDTHSFPEERQTHEPMNSETLSGKCIEETRKHLCNIWLFKNVPFTIFLLSIFLSSIAFWVPYLFVPDTARELGINEFRGAWLLSSIGITSTISRVVFGFLSDKTWINRLNLYSTALVIMGVTTALVPLLQSYWLLLCYTLVFGIFSGITVPLNLVIMVDIVGTEHITDAMGFKNFFGGMAALCGPPFVGWLFDISGSYTISYISCGVISTLSGIMMFFMPPCGAQNRSSGGNQV